MRQVSLPETSNLVGSLKSLFYFWKKYSCEFCSYLGWFGFSAFAAKCFKPRKAIAQLYHEDYWPAWKLRSFGYFCIEENLRIFVCRSPYWLWEQTFLLKHPMSVRIVVIVWLSSSAIVPGIKKVIRSDKLTPVEVCCLQSLWMALIAKMKSKGWNCFRFSQQKSENFIRLDSSDCSKPL